MLNPLESIRAIRLAQRIVHQGASATGEEARAYLSLCLRSNRSASLSIAAFIQHQKERANPWGAIVLLLAVVFIAFATDSTPLFAFIPAFLFAVYLTWLHREVLERIAPLADEKKA